MPYVRVWYDVPRSLAVREIFAAALFVLTLDVIGPLLVAAPGWFWLMCVANGLGLLVSEHLSPAFETFRTAAQFPLVYLFSASFVRTGRDIIAGCRVIAAIQFAALGIILVQILAGPIEQLNLYPAMDEGSQRFGAVRLGTVFGNPISSCMMLLILLWQFGTSVQRFWLRTGVVAAVCAVSAFTISFAPLVVMAMSSGILVLARSVFLTRVSVFRVVKIGALSVCVLAGLYWGAVPILKSQFVDRIGGGQTVEDYAADQLEFRFVTSFHNAYRAFQSRGWQSLLTGCGFDTAGQAAVRFGAEDAFRPHNVFLEVTVTMGLIGAAAYMWMLWDLARCTLAIRPKTPAGIRAKGLGLGVLAAVCSAVVVDPHLTQVIMIPLMFLLASLRFAGGLFNLDGEPGCSRAYEPGAARMLLGVGR
ncbi:MAG: hypothetical protein NTY19_06535 [Planctomycetota bacterium]|nr:hypothetical protein [Planctomycetota bacterium]